MFSSKFFYEKKIGNFRNDSRHFIQRKMFDSCDYRDISVGFSLVSIAKRYKFLSKVLSTTN